MKLDSAKWEQTSRAVAELAGTVDATIQDLRTARGPGDISPATVERLRTGSQALGDYSHGVAIGSANDLGDHVGSNFGRAIAAALDSADAAAGSLATAIERPTAAGGVLAGTIATLEHLTVSLRALEQWTQVTSTAAGSIDRTFARNIDPHLQDKTDAKVVEFVASEWNELKQHAGEVRDAIEGTIEAVRHTVPSAFSLTGGGPSGVDPAVGHRATVEQAFEPLDRAMAKLQPTLLALAEKVGPRTWHAAASRLGWFSRQVRGVRLALSDIPDNEPDVASALSLIDVIDRELSHNIAELRRDIDSGAEAAERALNEIHSHLAEVLELRLPAGGEPDFGR